MTWRTRPRVDNHERPFPIVGIGASAGGLYSFERFLKALPDEFGFSIVFVQHLSPTHESLLPDLLRSRRPDLDINGISQGSAIVPGQIYLCPPAKEVTIQKGIFQVADRPDEHVHLPIDEFFVSLAEYAAEQAIAVVFSGAGTDGARGVQAVRAAGGTIFVEDPATAEFSAMPLAAINTGHVDGVFSPEDIAGEILKFHGSGMVAISADSLITPAQFEPFYRLVYEKTGYRFNHYKKNVVARRIRRRMYLLGIAAVDDYLQVLAKKDTEPAQLASDLMIGVTSFFRDRLAWKDLHIEVTRKLAAEEGDSPIRAWTPACATGEEAYSIAMLLQHDLDLAGRKREIQVFATDVNDRALEQAREGTYPASIAADLPPEYLQKFFTHSEDDLSVVINKEIRQHVVFAKQDLLTDPPFSRLDLVICRNLLIYLEPDAQEKCITLFHYALKNSGYLFLGNAESPGRSNSVFVSVGHKKCRLYRKVGKPASVRLPVTASYTSERPSQLPSRPGASPEQRQSIVHAIQEKLLDGYAPAAVAINQNYEILYHNGPTNKYLSHPRGTPTQNLLDLLPENLRNRIRGGLYRAVKEARPVSIRTGIRVDDGRKRQVTLSISRLRENLFVIVFKEKGGFPEETETPPLDATAVEETAVRQLEHELSATREELQSHIEQLKGLNEELQSSNEELQAANEELETSREELQSLNEELITVNAQLQTKIEEEEETNNDLNNFLASTSIPTIFLDHRFRVKRFTPAMSRLIKLIPSDVGRPIIDMSQESLGPDLIADAQAVLDHLSPVRKEMMINGAWYVRTTLPYRTADNRIEGVVITYNEITDLKRAEEISGHLASFPQLNPNPVLELDASGEVSFFNPAAQRVLESLGLDRTSPKVFLPDDMADILRGWDGETESTVYRDLTVKGRVFGETVFLAPQFKVARIYAYDITERKRVEDELLNAEKEWERTFDSVPDMIAIIDGRHRVSRVNAAMARRLGMSAEDAIGLPCWEAVHGLSEPPGFCPHTLTMKDGGQHIEEVHEERLGGDFLVSTTPLYDGQGKMIGSVHVAHDVTERKKAEESLRKTVERLEIISNTASRLLMSKEPQKVVEALCQRVMEHLACDVFFNFLVDDERNCLRLNAYAGITEETVKEIRFLDFGVAVCGCAARDACRIVAENIPTTPDVRTDLVRSFGIKAHACHPLFAQGQVIGTLSFGTRSRLTFAEDELALMKTVADQVAVAMERVRLLRSAEERAEELEVRVEERTADLRRQEEMLRRANAYNRSLLESALDPLVTIDHEGKISDVNTATEHVTGCSRETLISTDFSSYFTDPEKARAGYEKVFKEGLVHDYELEICRRDGHVTPVLYNASVYRDEAGGVAGVLAAARDMTQQRRLEDQLRQAHKMEAMGTLAGGIAHDFNNILASIMGFTEMAMDDSPDRPAVQKGLSNVLKSAARARELVRQILTFSRKTEQPRGPMALSAALKETTQLLRASIPTTIEIVLNTEAASDTILASMVEIQQILMNLGANAAYAMQEKGGALYISLTDLNLGPDSSAPNPVLPPGGYLQLEVKDTGVGMTPDVMSRIFEPFFTTKGAGRGTGMGLAVVYGIVRDLRGAITVESEPGAGSVFRILLPKLEGDANSESPEVAETPGGKERVLFIDDEDMLVEWGQASLQKLGYNVTATTDSGKALRLFARDPSQFDLVVTDQTMPVMTGIQLARELLAIRKDIPIILCTGHSETVSAEEASATGVHQFLMKPLTKRELAAAIRKALDKSASKKQ